MSNLNYNANGSGYTSEPRQQKLDAEVFQHMKASTNSKELVPRSKNKIKEKHTACDKILQWQKCSVYGLEFPIANYNAAFKCFIKAESYIECVKTHFINKDYIAAASYIKHAMIQTEKILLSLDDSKDEEHIDVMQRFERDYIQTGIICQDGYFDSEDINLLLKKLEYIDNFEIVRDEVSEAIGSLEMLFGAVNYIFAHCCEEDYEEETI